LFIIVVTSCARNNRRSYGGLGIHIDLLTQTSTGARRQEQCKKRRELSSWLLAAGCWHSFLSRQSSKHDCDTRREQVFCSECGNAAANLVVVFGQLRQLPTHQGVFLQVPSARASAALISHLTSPHLAHLTHLTHLTSVYPCLPSSSHLNLPCCAGYALASCAIQLAINQRVTLLFTSGWFVIDRAGTASRPAISYLTRYPILHFNPHYCPLMAPKPH
jgi:hypothetical protein